MTQKIAKQPNLSQQVTTVLRQDILSKFQPGQRMPAIMELAKRFDVSYQTVREGLCALAEEGLIERRVGSGTYVSDMTKGRHVGVLAEMDITDPHTSYFYRRTPQQAAHFLRTNHVPVRLYTGHLAAGEDTPRPLTCTEFLEAVERHQLSGVVAFAPYHTFSPWCDALRRQHVPIVGHNELCDYMFAFDIANLIRKGAEFLLNRGRRRIALMDYCWPQDPSTVIEGFRSALAAADVTANPAWIRHNLNPNAPGAGWEEFRAIWAERGEKPDSLLICDDNLFPGVAMAILRMGIRVPEDLLVVTHFNKGSGMTIPFPVVKLETDSDAAARMMGGILIKLMKREPVPGQQIVLPYELVEAAAAAPRENVADDPATARSAVTSVPIAVANVTPTPRPNRRRKDEILV